MDEDTAMWKEGVRVRSFMEAQKGKKILYFVKFFSRNKKINALTEVTENQFLTASGINSESNPFGNKPQEITAHEFFSRAPLSEPLEQAKACTESLRPKGVPFSGVTYMKWILLVEVYKRVGKSVIWVCERVQRG